MHRMSLKVSLTVRITRGLSNEITAAAKALGISKNAYIAMTLARAINESKGGKENGKIS